MFINVPRVETNKGMFISIKFENRWNGESRRKEWLLGPQAKQPPLILPSQRAPGLLWRLKFSLLMYVNRREQYISVPFGSICMN